MTPAAAHFRLARFAPGGLQTQPRALHQPSVLLLNAGWLSVLAAAAITVLGLAAIATGAAHRSAAEPDYVVKQTIFAFLGLGAAAIMAVPHYQWMRRFSYPLLALVLLLLVVVLIPGMPHAIVHPKNGARRWINLYFMDFQPSELAKVAFVLALANYLRLRRNYRNFGGLLLPLLLTFIPMGLVLVEPDLGTALLFLPTLFAMLIAAGAKLRHITIVIVLGLAMAPLMYPMLKPYQKARIVAMISQFRGDDRHDNDIGYQSSRAMDVAAAGGWLGAGREHAAALVHYNGLPEEHNDMIFAVVCCRWGILGALTTWVAFLALCTGGMITAALCKDPFGRLVAVGLAALMFAQMTINTGMVIGLLPITGITLPFVSYGGSSLVVAWMMVGLILNIALRRNRHFARHSFEFDPAQTPLEPYELTSRSRATAADR